MMKSLSKIILDSILQTRGKGCAALALYGFYTSLGDRSLFGGAVLEE
jgi:hypothetical protein